MEKFQKIGFFTPLNEEILLYWEKTKHIEDGILFIRADGEWVTTCLTVRV